MEVSGSSPAGTVMPVRYHLCAENAAPYSTADLMVSVLKALGMKSEQRTVLIHLHLFPRIDASVARQRPAPRGTGALRKKMGRSLKTAVPCLQ